MKNKLNIFLIGQLLIIISGCTSFELAYSNYTTFDLEKVVQQNRRHLSNKILVLPILYQGQKREMCINSGSYHQINEKNNIELEESINLLEKGLKGWYFNKKHTSKFSSYIINNKKYKEEFKGKELMAILNEVVDKNYCSEEGQCSKIKMSIQNEDYIKRLIKFLITHNFWIQEGSFIGGYDLCDLKHEERLKITN